MLQTTAASALRTYAVLRASRVPVATMSARARQTCKLEQAHLQTSQPQDTQGCVLAFNEGVCNEGVFVESCFRKVVLPVTSGPACTRQAGRVPIVCDRQTILTAT